MKNHITTLAILLLLSFGISTLCMEEENILSDNERQEVVLSGDLPNEIWATILESNYLDQNILENTEAKNIHDGLASIKQKLSTYSKVVRLVCKTSSLINYGPTVLRDKLRHFYGNILSKKFLEHRNGGLHPKNSEWGLGTDTDSKIAIFMLGENKPDLSILIHIIELDLKEERKPLRAKIIALLLLYHPNVNFQDDKGWTALRAAAGRHLDSNDNENKEIIAMLLAHGADVNVSDNKDNAALRVAVIFHHIKDYKEIIAMLLDHGAKIEPAILRMAIHLHNYNTKKISYKEIIEMLLAHGVDVNNSGEDGALLPYALSRHSDDNNMNEIIALLLAYGADVNIVDKDGDTCLNNAVFSHYYSGNNCKEIIAMLLSHGGNVNKPNKPGKIALSIAVFWHSKYKNDMNQEVIAMLLAHGADVNIPDNYGDTALSLARENNFHDFDELVKNYSEQGTLKNLCLRVLLTHQHLIENKLDILPNNLRKLFEF